MDDKVIIVDDLLRTFGSFTAVDHITFDVKKGEIFGFLGANGAGKTTTMKMLTGLLSLSGGKATVAGFDVQHNPEKVKKRIGYMSQKFALYDDLSVWENIRFYGGVYGLQNSEIKERGEAMLEKLNFGDVRDQMIGSLPLGWKQKLAFSVALLHQPGIVFLDEPTGGVDPVTRRQFWEMIYEVAETGTTVFVTTHYMDEAEYCDRIGIMVAGKLPALDTPAKLKQQFDADSVDGVFVQLARGKQKE
ncbi:MAG TPA: ABC transporter ATP-binding protein [Balneolales bacterium]|nr:ABC transporter ATP-binding protein [Balneolales bacterium]